MVLTNNFKNVIINLIRKNCLAIIIKRQDPRLLQEVGDLIDAKSTLTAWVQIETYQVLPRTQPRFV
jgi:Iap family predicted aminopeptidase